NGILRLHLMMDGWMQLHAAPAVTRHTIIIIIIYIDEFYRIFNLVEAKRGPQDFLSTSLCV
ncbi:hypothetical protein ACJX0J_033106, partial [Zea mays]